MQKRSHTQPMTTSNFKTIYTVSDLHLFCKRSEGPHYIGHLYEAVKEADYFVLNGDIFDFKWSTLKNVEETVDAAIHWLARFVSAAPGCHFYYMLGNHDNHALFVEALDEFASSRDNFSWHAHYIRLGNTLYMHGDVSMRKMTTVDLVKYREAWRHKDKRGRNYNRVYDVAFKSGVHRQLPKMAFPNQRVAERLNHYLDHIGHGRESGIETVYFGHTHVAVNDYVHKGVRYFNCGAPMPGMEFNILKAHVPEHELLAAS
jgi:UDP-2,3-diacylglucosamine hydrolase